MKFNVKGMTCAACSARVEKAVKAVDGVILCNVNLLTNSMEVSGTADAGSIIAAVEKAGYSASEYGRSDPPKSANTDSELSVLIKRLSYSLVFLIILMYISMGHSMWGFPLPSFLADNPMSLGLIQFIISSVVLVINQKFFTSGIKAVINRAPNMDTLVCLGSGASFIYSVYILFKMSHELLFGFPEIGTHMVHDLYFESAAMIPALITLGKMLEAYSKGKTTSALDELINLAPKQATIIKDGVEVTVNADSLKKGDIMLVKPGESFAADGVIIEGEGSVDESALTGESIPVDKVPGDMVSTATINKFGHLKVEITSVGEETALSKIIRLVSDASATKAPIAKIADKVSGIFVPSVLAIAAVTLIIWLILGKTIGFSLERAIAVLVVSCPCALGLATPVAIMVSSGKGAKNGILFKNATSLENLGKADTVIFDKTGTITKGEPSVTDILPIGAESENELLKYACTLEAKSEHPLATAIINKCKECGISAGESEEFEVIPGKGLKAIHNGTTLYGGNAEYINNIVNNNNISAIAEKLSGEGKTVMEFAQNDNLLGVIAVADTIKEEAPKAIKRLHNMGIETVMLTGDNQLTAEHIAKKTGIDTVISHVLPHEKQEHVNRLCKKGKVVMVGDGINDAPALTSADIGVAVAKGSDIAIDAAQVVLMKNSLLDVPAAITLSRVCTKNIKENLFWAFIYNIIGIPLAAGVFIASLGWRLTPMFGAAAMILSSFCVLSNSLGINRPNIYTKHTIKHKKRKDLKTMEKIFKVEGMMCPHCEARVKQILEEINGVESAVTSHTEGTAKLVLSADVPDEVIAKAITDAGYKVL